MVRNWRFLAFSTAAAVLLLHAGRAYTTAPVEPDRWNAPQDRRNCNNCYNYATNTPDGSFAQPGWGAGGSMESPYTCGGVTSAAESDGLQFAGRTMEEAQDRCDASCCLVALFVSEDNKDFHWYREDADGTWSHKPGWTPATQLDDSDPPQPITDPLTANRNGGHPSLNYTQFCGFLCVCRDQLQPLAGRKPPKAVPADWYDGCPENGCHATPRIYDFPGCIPDGEPSLHACQCCSCVLRITGPDPGGTCSER